MVKAEVREPYRPVHQWIYQLGALALFGDRYHVKLKYPPLRETSAKEDEEVKTSKQTRMLGQLEAGLIDEVEASQWSQQEKLCPVPTRLGTRAARKAGDTLEDVPSRKTSGKTKKQGAKNEDGRDHVAAGRGSQVPRRA
jgi:hypothetical protein